MNLIEHLGAIKFKFSLLARLASSALDEPELSLLGEVARLL